jgi:hypothetical protein
MASEVVTYIGLNSFDLILYQACVLTKLQKKVLIIEDNEKVEQSPFSSMLEIPLGLEEKKDIITFRRIDFAFFQPGLEVLKNYDTVFVSAGFSKSPYELTVSREIYVTDLFVQNMEAVKQIMNVSFCNKRSMVIRNNVFSYVNLDLLSDNMEGLVDKAETVIIDMNENDHFNALLCQRGQFLRFKLLSSNMKKYLLREIKHLCPEADKRVLHMAYKAASRGGVT